jgi:hypothetical protein
MGACIVHVEEVAGAGDEWLAGAGDEWVAGVERQRAPSELAISPTFAGAAFLPA